MSSVRGKRCHRALAEQIAGAGGGVFSVGYRKQVLPHLCVDGRNPGVGATNGSVLLLPQMVITHLAHLGRRRCHLPQSLEHPVDPKKTSTAPSAWKCSSIWATKALGEWRRLLGNTLITFDQRRLGQVVKKSTTLSINLGLHHGLCCDHDPGAHQQREVVTSSDLSRYPRTPHTTLPCRALISSKGLRAKPTSQQASAEAHLSQATGLCNPSGRNPPQLVPMRTNPIQTCLGGRAAYL